MSRSSQSRTNSTSRAAPAAARSSAALTRRRGPRKDPDSDHFVLFKDGAPIGTIRYFPPLAKLGRLAVLKEGRGVGAGRLLCDALEEHLVHRRGKAGVAHALDSQVTIVANSQAHAQVSLVRGPGEVQGADLAPLVLAGILREVGLYGGGRAVS